MLLLSTVEDEVITVVTSVVFRTFQYKNYKKVDKIVLVSNNRYIS